MTFRKRAHKTEAARLVAGVDSSAYWDFQPGQRVRVVEGFEGTVERVEDGPNPGNEEYIVTLDGGMGGGSYSSSELSSVDGVTAVWVDTPESNALFDLASQVAGAGNQAMDWEPEFEGDEPWRITDVTSAAVEGSEHQASEDYPELGSILVDRPPLVHAVTGAKTAMALGYPAQGENHTQFPGSLIVEIPGGALQYSKGNVADPQGATIHAVYVDADKRRSGIATMLLDRLAEEFAGHAIDPGGKTAEGEALWNRWMSDNGWVDVNGIAWIETEDEFYDDDYDASLKTTAAKDARATDYGLLWDPSLASVRALADQVDWDAIPTTTIAPGEPLYSSEEVLSSAPIDKVVSGREPFREGYDPQVVIDAQGRKVVVDGNHRAAMYRAMGKPMPAHVFDTRHTAGPLNFLLKEWGDTTINKLPEEYRPGAQGEGSMWSYDWCRFRKNRRCMYAKELNVEATEEMGYSVWEPVDRGLCPRDKWDQQKACPVGEPGPHSEDPHARIDATVPFDQGGQRNGVPGRTAVELTKKGSYFFPDGREVTIRDMADLAIEHGVLPEAKVIELMGDKLPRQTLMQKVQPLLYQMWGRGELEMRSTPYEPPPPAKPDQEVIDWFDTIKVGAKAPFEFFATWSDVREKAKRIRAEGGVRILSVTDRELAGQVQGEGSVYNTRLEFEPHRRTVAMWDCDCPWSTYSWGRTRQWKKFEGRQCAHALALGWEAQSRGMFGEEVTEDSEVLAKVARERPPRDRYTNEPADLDEVVDWIMIQTRVVEPKITADMKNVARRCGGTLKGLENKFKARDSLMRKIKDKLKMGQSLDDPFAVISDALRYTMVFPIIDHEDGGEEWAGDVDRALYAIELDLRYKISEPENSWPKGDSYSGFHVTLTDPGDNLQIELQFHTSDSYDLKYKKMHALYKEFRTLPDSSQRKRDLWNIFTKFWDDVRIPLGATEFGDPRFYPPPGVKDKNWRPKAASANSELRDAPAVTMAVAMLSEGIPLPTVVSTMKDMGAPDGFAIVQAAVTQPFKAQVPGKGQVDVTELEPNKDKVKLDDGSEVPASQVLYPTYHPTKGLSLSGIKLAETDSTGVMVALKPPESVCEALMYENGEDPDNMHITLCYLGKTDEIDRDDLEAAALGFASTASVLTGRIAGFLNDDRGDADESAVLVALWDVPGLDRFRLALKDSLTSAGVSRAENHGYTPHTTLAYGDEPFTDLPELADEAAGLVPFDTLVVAYGGEWNEFPLGGPPVARVAAAFGPVDRDTIRAMAGHTAGDTEVDRIAPTIALGQPIEVEVLDNGAVEATFEVPEAVAHLVHRSDLHEEPEPALPETDGVEDEHGVLKPGSPKLSWLMGTTASPAVAQADNLDIAAGAREALAKMGLKAFTPAEQQMIIEEGEDVQAGNLASLDIEGTHYAELETALLEAEEEGIGIWL